MPLQICTGCGHLTNGSNRCTDCGPNPNRPQPKHHTGTDRKRMKATTAAANKNPNTTCWLCGQTANNPPPGYNPKWSADHEHAGQPGSKLHPAHLGCNSARRDRTPQQFRAWLATRFPHWPQT